MRLFASRIMMVAFAAISGAVLWGTLAQTPAFNPALTSETVGGGKRTPLIRAMFDRGEYEFQRGHGYLTADTLALESTLLRKRLSLPESEGSLALTASQALETAVHLDPGNAHAWSELAWARARLGDGAGSLEALRISSEIAPFNLTLANKRLSLASFLFDPRRDFGEKTERAIAAIQRDIDQLRRSRGRALAVRMEASPHLAVLARQPASNMRD